MSDLSNIYKNIMDMKEIEEQKKREEIIKSNNKSFDEDQFKENLKKVKENLIKQYPLSAMDVVGEVKKACPDCKNHDIKLSIQ